jgi:hypothetical protein
VCACVCWGGGGRAERHVPRVSVPCASIPLHVRSNALRNDLNHPNEYIRGCTLRFLSKLKEQDLIEPLVASIKVSGACTHPWLAGF